MKSPQFHRETLGTVLSCQDQAERVPGEMLTS